MMIDRMHAYGKTIALPSTNRCPAISARRNGAYLPNSTTCPSNRDARRLWRQRSRSPQLTAQLRKSICLQPAQRMHPSPALCLTTGILRSCTAASASSSSTEGNSHSAGDLAASLAGSRNGNQMLPKASAEGPKRSNQGTTGDGDGKDPPSATRLASGGNDDNRTSWGLIAQIAVLLAALFVVARLVGDHDSTPRRSSAGRRSTFRRLKSVFTQRNQDR